MATAEEKRLQSIIMNPRAGSGAQTQARAKLRRLQRGKKPGAAAGKGSPKRQKSQRQKNIDRLRRDQKRAAKKVESIFKKFQDPKSTEGDIKKALGQIKKIDVKQFTGRAAGDIQRLRDIATTKGPTEGAKALLAEQRAEQGIAIEEAERGGQERAQSAFEQLAQRGGASAAARERLVGQTGAASLREQQRARRAGAAQRLGIRSEDEARKLQIAGGLSGQEANIGQLSAQAQTAEAAQALAREQARQRAREFDVTGKMRAQELRARGQAGAIQTGSQQQTQFGAAQELAAAQRQAAKKQGGGGGLVGGLTKAVGSVFG